MFIDPAVVEKIYTSSKEAGHPLLGTGLFDKRIAIPLELLPGHMKFDYGEELTTGRIDELVSHGWFPVCSAQPGSTAVPGFPLYAPGRIALYLELERHGYSPAELRALAKYEEMWIDEVLSVDDLAYVDNDLEQLQVHVRELVASLEAQLRYSQQGSGKWHEYSYRQ